LSESRKPSQGNLPPLRGGRLKGRPVGIVGVGSYVPERVLTNFDLERMVDTSDEWIRERTGIRERRIALDEQATSDLAVEAALRALKDAGVKPEELDLVVVATVSPDMLFPATACLVQDRIGAKNAFAFDLEAGCTSFVCALTYAATAIASGVHETALVIGADALSKITDWTDRTTCILFADGAGAVVLRPCEEGYGVLSAYLRADGSGWDHAFVPAGGSRRPASEETVRNREHFIKMHGREVFKFAVNAMAEAIETSCQLVGISVDQVKLFVPHQANYRIIAASARKLHIPEERFVINLERYGNTSAASIPIALDEAVKGGRVERGDYIVLVAFGAGLTWGANVIRWAKG